MTIYARRNVLLENLRTYAVTPKTASAVAVHAAVTLTAAVQNLITGIKNPDVPRALSITGVKAGLTLTGNVVAYGKDINGASIKETIALNGDATVAGVIAFAEVHQVIFPVRVTAADTVSIGYCDKIGMPDLMCADTVLMVTLDGTYETSRPTVVYDKAAISKNTVDPTSACATGKGLTIYYVAYEPALV